MIWWFAARMRGCASVEALLDALNRAAMRRKLELLAGYDTSHTGEVFVGVSMGTKTLLTADEFQSMPDEESVRTELDEGELITMTALELAARKSEF